MICISISEAKQLDPVLKNGAGLVELRLDLIKKHPSELYPHISEGVQTIVTCRKGIYGEQERIELLKSGIELGASYVDIELESSQGFSGQIMKVAASHGCEVIFSHHDFQQTPPLEELVSLLEACFDRGGAVAKIATQVEKVEDAINLLTLHKQPGRKVLLGMGEAGRITRVAAPLLGSEFTFASALGGGETAPGQMSAAQLIAIYNILQGS